MASQAKSMENPQDVLISALRQGNVSGVSSALRDNPKIATKTAPHPFLHNAVTATRNCSEMLRLLLEAGIPPDTYNLATVSALHLAAKMGCLPCLKQLLEAGATVDLHDLQGQTPLHYAVSNIRGGSGQCTQLLLERGASVNVSCEGRITPLHVAAEVDNVTAARLLLDAGACHSAQDKDGCTPLHLATSSSMVEALLAVGADVTAKDNSLQTPLERVIEFHPTVAQTLLDAGVEVRGNPQEKDLRVFFHLNTVTGGSSPCEVDLLEKMANCGHYDLLKHPICEVFLHLKWYHVCPLFYINSLINVVMVVSFSTFLTLHPSFNCTQHSIRMGNVDCTTDLDEQTDIWIVAMRILAGFLLAMVMLASVVQILSLRLLYVRRLNFWFSLFFSVSALTLIITDCKIGWFAQYLGVVALLTGWTKVTFLLSLTPTVGTYMQIFVAVCVRMIKFTIVFIPLFLGFTAAFTLTFDCQYFGSPVAAFLKALAMLVGDVAYNDIFAKPPIGLYPEMREVLYIVYLLWMTITAANLLIGLAIEDTQALMKRARANRLAFTVRLEMYIDEFFNSIFFTKYMSPCLLRRLRDMASLLPNLEVQPLNVSPSSSYQKLFDDEFVVHQPKSSGKREATKSFNIFVCPNRSRKSGKVYRSLNAIEYSGAGYHEQSAGYSVPASIISDMKDLIHSDRFKKKWEKEE